MRDLDDAESENARLKVSISDAKALVASWIGDSDSEDNDPEPEFGVITGWGGQGLGAVAPKKQEPPSKILQKLKPKNKDRHQVVESRKESSDSDEEESRTSVGRKRKKPQETYRSKRKAKK